MQFVNFVCTRLHLLHHRQNRRMNRHQLRPKGSSSIVAVSPKTVRRMLHKWSAWLTDQIYINYSHIKRWLLRVTDYDHTNSACFDFVLLIQFLDVSIRSPLLGMLFEKSLHQVVHNVVLSHLLHFVTTLTITNTSHIKLTAQAYLSHERAQQKVHNA